MMHPHADSFARVRKVTRNKATHEKANNSSRRSIRDTNLNRYFVVCQSCDWNTQYLVESEDLDISDSITECPVCHMKSIECSHIRLRQDGYPRFTSDTLAVTRIRNRNKVLDWASRAYEQLSYFTEIIIVKGLLDMDRIE
jgi:hypothetical protein